MQRHPHFELWLHDNNELEHLLGSPVIDRTCIHEWPLSSVERIQTEDGRRHIYKVQAPPTVEAEFYSNARSPLLVSVRVLEAEGATTAILMDELLSPRLSDINPQEDEAVAIAAQLVRHIAQIEGELPVLFDISTEERWADYMGHALDDMRALVGDGSFRAVNREWIDRFTRWAESPALLDAICSSTGYVHSDLKADNILVAPDGFRILDWQRPIRGPVALDRTTLLLSLNIDPTNYVPAGMVQLYHFLHIAWYTQTARKWYPQGKQWFDGFIIQIGEKLERLVQNPT